MTNSKELFNDLHSKIRLDELPDEITAILHFVLHHEFGLTRTDIAAGKEINLDDRSGLYEIISRINLQEPPQYILGDANFYGRSFFVTPEVLIPRPETELLVEETIRQYRLDNIRAGTVLDLGTGSGCIAVTLAKELPGMDLVAVDVSEKAVGIAQANAKKHHVAITFLLQDLLASPLLPRPVEIIVSNPPYVTPDEAAGMKINVLSHEPALALFVPADDPLVFYRVIAAQAQNILSSTGTIVVEINEKFGQEVAALFVGSGFEKVSVLRDFNGKDRIVTAKR